MLSSCQYTTYPVTESALSAGALHVNRTDVAKTIVAINSSGMPGPRRPATARNNCPALLGRLVDSLVVASSKSENRITKLSKRVYCDTVKRHTWFIITVQSCTVNYTRAIIRATGNRTCHRGQLPHRLVTSIIHVNIALCIRDYLVCFAAGPLHVL